MQNIVLFFEVIYQQLLCIICQCVKAELFKNRLYRYFICTYRESVLQEIKTAIGGNPVLKETGEAFLFPFAYPFYLFFFKLNIRYSPKSLVA